jgi:hypothetical protein
MLEIISLIMFVAALVGFLLYERAMKLYSNQLKNTIKEQSDLIDYQQSMISFLRNEYERNE